MLVEKDIINILGHKAEHDHFNVSFDGSDILVRFVEDASKLSLTTSVYFGGNYIPSSVRNSLSHKFTNYDANIKTYLTVDEQHFQVHLHYLGEAEPLSYFQLKELLEEFGLVATKWRNFLDEHDRNDLVYIHAKT